MVCLITFTLQVALLPAKLAVIVAFPAPVPCTTPFVTLATPVLLLDQVTASLFVPFTVAVNVNELLLPAA